MLRSTNGQFGLKRMTTVGIVVALGLVGCSGGTTDTAGTSPAAPAATSGSVATPAATSAGDPAPTAAPSVDLGGAELNTAVVVIGGDRYEVTGVRCDIFTARYIQAGNYGEDPEVIIVLPPEGWESQGDVFSPPSVVVTVGSGADETVWAAGDATAVVFMPGLKGLSQIDSYTVPDGRPVHATGTATFIDTTSVAFGRDAKPVAGSFEVTCP